MGTIGSGYGSEWHLLRYLGYHRADLQKAILESTGGSGVDWLDFNFSTVNKPKHHDQEWKGITFIDDSSVREKWKTFWPQTGNPPNWDAVGKLTSSAGKEWLLVEAKAHLEEMHSDCGATNPISKEMISTAMLASQPSFGSSVPISEWHCSYYQFCNRLSVLHFLMRECDPPTPAHLVLIYFFGDENGKQNCPQSISEWKPAIQNMYAAVGIQEGSDLFNHIHHVFLPVNPRIQS